MIDTDRFFVIGVDSLTNINAFNPRVYTTGPASINPNTQKPWALSFPDLTCADLVRAQKPLIESLGISKLYAAIGASGGSVQSMQWAAMFPEMVERVVAVVPPGIRMSEYTAAMIELWGEPIRVDADWNDGDYYDKSFPDKGLVSSLRITTTHGLNYGLATNMFPVENAQPEEGKGSRHLQSETLFMEYVEQMVQERKAGLDPNSILKMINTYQTFDIRKLVKDIQAKFQFIICDDDMIFQSRDSLKGFEALEAASVDVELVRFNSDFGHLGAIADTGKFSGDIHRFLNS